MWAYNRGGVKEAQAEFVADTSMLKVKSVIDSIKLAEGRLLIKRRIESKANAKQTLLFFVIALSIIFTLLYVLFRYIKRTFANQKLIEQRTLEANVKLQDLFETTQQQAEELEAQQVELVKMNNEVSQ